MDPIVYIQGIKNDFISSIYDLRDELSFLRLDIEKLKKKFQEKIKGGIGVELDHIEDIGNDLKLAIDDIIEEIKILRRDVEELKKKAE